MVASRKAMCGPGWAELAEDMDFAFRPPGCSVLCHPDTIDVREREGGDILKTGMKEVIPSETARERVGLIYCRIIKDI